MAAVVTGGRLAKPRHSTSGGESLQPIFQPIRGVRSINEGRCPRYFKAILVLGVVALARPVASAEEPFGQCSAELLLVACAGEVSDPDAHGECSSTSGQWENATGLVVGVERAHARVYGANYCETQSSSNWSRSVSTLAIYAYYDVIVLDNRITLFRWAEESESGGSSPGTRNSTSFTILDRTWDHRETEWGEGCTLIYPELGRCWVGPPPPAPHRPWGHMLWCDDSASDSPAIEAATCVVDSETERLPGDAVMLTEWGADR